MDLKYVFLHLSNTCQQPCKRSLRSGVRWDIGGPKNGGQFPHDIRLDDPWLTHSKTTQKSVKWHLDPKIFFACGALKGASPLGPRHTAQNRLPAPSPSSPSAPTGESPPQDTLAACAAERRLTVWPSSAQKRLEHTIDCSLD